MSGRGTVRGRRAHTGVVLLLGVLAACSVDTVVGRGSSDAPPVLDGTPTACGPQVCDRAREICVINRALQDEYVCAPVPQGCEADRSCSCVATVVCTAIYTACTDAPEDNRVVCNCPQC